MFHRLFLDEHHRFQKYCCLSVSGLTALTLIFFFLHFFTSFYVNNINELTFSRVAKVIQTVLS